MSKLSADKGITDYETLVSEQKRLKELLKIQKQIIQQDIQNIKYELNPAVKVLSTLSKFTSREKETNTILRMGTNATIDWASKSLLASQPILRMVLPAIVKNYSSHYEKKVVPFLQNLTAKIFRKRVKAIQESKML